MRYISTRGGVEPITFSEAVMMGLATDGGLLLPEEIPSVDAATLAQWAKLNFQELAIAVMRRYVEPDLSITELTDLVQRSYATFNHPDITPLVSIGGHSVLELFHGPTLAFKDVALQFLGNLFEHLLKRSGGQLNIVGATSGDTGSAAIYGVRGKQRINIFILHPYQRVSKVQEHQMTTVLDDNVHNIAIRGTFDDGQQIVKALFNDLEFKSHYSLGAVNSINWARILAQIVYYFYAWGQITKGDTSQSVSFSVPTGNFGDIFAGFLALRMGLPINKLILATNRNDILFRFIDTGTYQTEKVRPTISPSMDIQIASNFERYLYYLMDEDGQIIRQLMEQLSQTGKLSITQEKYAQIANTFVARRVGEDETLACIQKVYQETGYVLDPHTAVGVHGATDFPGSVCLATAHPAKFGDAVKQAIGEEPELPAELADLLQRASRCTVVNADLNAIKNLIIAVLNQSKT